MGEQVSPSASSTDLPDVTDEPARPDGRHWFQPLAEFLGPAYLRNAFTQGTEQEVEFLWGALSLSAGSRVLDVGCGPGRHALALARRGATVTGIDISEEFVRLAGEAAHTEGLACEFQVADARHLPYDGQFDAVICLCQGAFGLPGGSRGPSGPSERGDSDDRAVFDGLVRALHAGGRLGLTAFSAYFAVQFLEEGEAFDADRGLNHEVATLRDTDGKEQQFDLWTSCWTPRELRLLAEQAGLVDVHIQGVTPGRYEMAPPDVERPELLLLATKA